MPDEKPKPWTPGQERRARVFMKWLGAANTWVYRASGGKIGGRFPGGAPVLLLTTIGRKSGQPRTVPLLYLRDGEHYVVVASKGGMFTNPFWLENLDANPRVDVEISGSKRVMHARRASEAEKAALWPRLVAMYSSYAEYQARTERAIPVVILAPA